MIKRRASRVVRIGGVEVGGAGPVVVQSMTKTDTRDVAATVGQIRQLEECGCDIVRVAVPDMAAAEALVDIKRQSGLPVVADIHFDYRLALAALKAGVDGLRLNPGNISDHDQISTVVRAAKEREVPIRVGVNAGSLPRESASNGPVVGRMVDAALEEVRLLESLDFDLIKVSLKAFDVPTTIDAYRRIARMVNYPLHIGITEAGGLISGTVKSSIGLGMLLWSGIGDTLRVSLSADPVEEVRAGFEMLKALNLRHRGVNVIACPSCARQQFNVIKTVETRELRLAHIHTPLTLSVIGCVVNGPGEARETDIGLTGGGKGSHLIYLSGVADHKIEDDDLVDHLVALVEEKAAQIEAAEAAEATTPDSARAS